MTVKTTKKNSVGRPPYYKTAEDMQKRIDEYFLTGMNKKTVTYRTKDGPIKYDIPVPTITGLVLYLGFSDRQSFYDLEKAEKFSCTIKTARTRIENIYEEQLQVEGGSGPIFALKNFGWDDKQSIDHTTNGKSIGDEPDLSKLTNEELKVYRNLSMKVYGSNS